MFNFTATYPIWNLNVAQQAPFFLPPALQLPNATYIAQSKGQLYTFMFGPQITFRKNAFVQPFVRPMIGGVRDRVKLNLIENGVKLLPSDLNADETGLALGGGGGVDIRITNRVYARFGGRLGAYEPIP